MSGSCAERPPGGELHLLLVVPLALLGVLAQLSQPEGVTGLEGA